MRRISVLEQVMQVRFGPGRLYVAMRATHRHQATISIDGDELTVRLATPGRISTAWMRGSWPPAYRGASAADDIEVVHSADVDFMAFDSMDFDSRNVDFTDTASADLAHLLSQRNATTPGAAAAASGFIGTLTATRRTVWLRTADQVAHYRRYRMACQFDRTPMGQPWPPGFCVTDPAQGAALFPAVQAMPNVVERRLTGDVVFAGAALDLLLRTLANAIRSGAMVRMAGQLVDDPTDRGSLGWRPWDDLGFATAPWRVAPWPPARPRPGAISVHPPLVESIEEALRLDSPDSGTVPREATVFVEVEPVADDAGDGLVALRGTPVLATATTDGTALVGIGYAGLWLLVGQTSRLALSSCRLGDGPWRAIPAAAVHGFAAYPE